MKLIIKQNINRTITIPKQTIETVMDCWDCDEEQAIKLLLTTIDFEEIDYYQSEEILSQTIIKNK